ncbi:lipid A export permease/ATP-binding protein MsbA [Hydrocarboniclastica marina]|uniref:Lipid A export permease/ATP-binding protein MsbA n=1 Tax=Hydrocarboniclastica marina TaxID=2259620 RepID=A0A4P7XIG4_9ALTE|nr:lipid A export permease/ATP-binding protein MsbA [Hydrocarboniclastica marina]QCF26314.1 lipid A export permease/ATP-binding protein MsbA [Hydrocarboniclastica marina]
MPRQDSDLPSNWQVYRRLLGYLKPFWGAFALAVVGNALYAVASTGMAAAMEFVIQAIENPTAANRLLVPALIVAVFAVRGVGFFLGTYFISKVGRNIVNLMRTQIFDHLMHLPCRYFDSSSSGHLVSRITYNVEQVTGAATNAVTIMLREGLTVIGLLSYMVYVNWKLTLIFLVLAPVIGGLVSYVSKRFRRLSQKIQSSMGDVTHVAGEAIAGYRVVRVFGGSDYESQRFRKVSHNNLRQSMKMAMTKAISTPVVQILIAFSIALLVWIALAPEVQAGMTTGEFVAFITAATTLAKPIRQLTSVQEQVQKGIAASHDVFLSLDVAVETDTGTHAPERVLGEIEFDQVCFRYQDTLDNVLKDVSFRVEPNSTIAFVGRSGSGKSTLVSLLPRFYEYSSGEIRLDGIPLKSYQLRALRDQIALVNQDVVLFNDTVANNIAYGGLRGVSREDIREAARKAHALEFIDRLPQGLDTEIGDNGIMLSGGQRQRLAIARALLKDAPILILDEATSALDTESERYIQQALEAVMQGRTTLVIAHRLSTVENADQIIVMDDGRVVEAGTHEELIVKKGNYAQLHSMQFSE